VGEFGLIKRIKDKLSFSHRDIIKGIGDDAGVTHLREGASLLSTTDTLVEDVHFDLGLISAYNLGKKSLAVNISDIAAMGGMPRFFLISLSIPSRISVEFIDEFMNGLREVANRFQTYPVGGDTSLSPENLIISITVLGEASPGYEIYRDNANIGNQIFVTGDIGDSALGLNILMSRNYPYMAEERFKDLIEKHNNPTPRVTEGRLIAENHIASAMIDISDGLISDLGHICKQSGVGARIWLEKIPASEAFQKYFQEFTDRPSDLQLGGGEDYEILFTVDNKKLEALNQIKPRFHTKVTHIGEIIGQECGIAVLRDNGQKYSVKIEGFDHFS